MANRLKLLIIALDQMDAPELPAIVDGRATPYWAELHSGAVKGIINFLQPDEAFWPSLLSPSLSQAGLRAGLINLAWQGSPPSEQGFFIGRAGGAGQAPVVAPPELAEDLVDYLADPPWPSWHSGHTPAGGQLDLAYAEQAAVSRIRFEHARRLARVHELDLLAVDFGGLALTRSLFGASSGRWLVYLRQLDYYTRRLDLELAPRAAGLISPQGLLLLRDPDHPHGSELGPMDMASASQVISQLLRGGDQPA